MKKPFCTAIKMKLGGGKNAIFSTRDNTCKKFVASSVEGRQVGFYLSLLPPGFLKVPLFSRKKVVLGRKTAYSSACPEICSLFPSNLPSPRRHISFCAHWKEED